VLHFVFCAVGFLCFPLYFVLLHSCFTSCFVLLDFCVSLCGFLLLDSCVSHLYFVLLDSCVSHSVLCCSIYPFQFNFPAIMLKAGTNHCLARQPLTPVSHRTQYSVIDTAVSVVALVK